MSDYLEVCEQAAKDGGEVLLEWLGKIHVREKGPKDLVTEADLAAQTVIRDRLLGTFPTHDFLGEEDWADDSTSHATPEPGRNRWIVDPLDGTTNFVHGLHGFSVSVALECAGELVAGTVYDPISKECYTASRGGGAYLNGNRLAVSPCTEIAEALVASSFSAQVDRDSDEITRFVDVLVACQALRRLGSAALNLSYLAAGRLDGYWASSVKTWDVAAGVLLVLEAGGIVTGLDGNPLDLAQPHFAAASTPILHQQLRAALAT